MKENVLTSFIRDTYKTTSIIPYVITGQVILFILLHIFDLLSFAETTSVDLYNVLFSKSILPIHPSELLTQPWSLATHPFIYDSLWNLLFDCLWLYWMGKLFLSFLNTKQLNTLFIGGVSLGTVLFIGFGLIPFLSHQNLFWHTTAFGLAAIISSLTMLVPNYEIRLLLLGNIKLKWIAAVYLGFQFAFLVSTNKPAAVAYLFVVFAGMIFMHQLQRGKDWSLIFSKKKRKLKVVTTNYEDHKRSEHAYPDQHEIDHILDKISLKGYESLTSREKDMLFRASKRKK